MPRAPPAIGIVLAERDHVDALVAFDVSHCREPYGRHNCGQAPWPCQANCSSILPARRRTEPTFMLTHWTRDRPTGRLVLEAVVKILSVDAAHLVELKDRGRIAPGLKADINVIDYDRLQLAVPHAAYDLPGGGPDHPARWFSHGCAARRSGAGGGGNLRPYRNQTS